LAGALVAAEFVEAAPLLLEVPLVLAGGVEVEVPLLSAFGPHAASRDANAAINKSFFIFFPLFRSHPAFSDETRQ
jgi:hypothetical protein